MFFKRNSKKALATLVILSVVIFLTGCAKKDQQTQQKATAVKSMTVIERPVQLIDEYAGQIQGKNEVKIQARVSGNIVEKMIKGGQNVRKGQPLFKIDDRIYLSTLMSAQAQLAQAQASLGNIMLDAQRYRELYKSGAISQQMLTNQEALLQQQQATVNSYRAMAQKAQDDLNDTLIVSPIDGRLYTDDVSLGAFVQTASTVLVTVGEINPVFAQFNMSENEYLELRNLYKESLSNSEWGDIVSITLSNGEQYPIKGKVTEINRGLGNNSGTLEVKANFDNSNGLLIPGMFTKVKIEGMTLPNALLIPQRAVQQVLDKSYVMVIKDDKASAKPIVLGKKIGSFYIVEKGLTKDEVFVVEGLTKIQEGAPVQPTAVKPEDLSLTFE